MWKLDLVIDEFDLRGSLSEYRWPVQRSQDPINHLSTYFSKYLGTQTLQCPRECQSVDSTYACILSSGVSVANLLLLTEGILIKTVSEFLQYIVIASNITVKSKVMSFFPLR